MDIIVKLLASEFEVFIFVQFKVRHTMTQEETIEVDPEELSDEVLKDLVQESGIDKEKAEEFADKAQFEEMEYQDPNKKNVFESFKIKSNFGFKKLKSLYQSICDKNARPFISEVEPNGNDTIIFHVEHPRLSKHKIRFSKDDVEIANLMDYHRVDNPIDLEGKRLVLDEISVLKNNNSRRHSVHYNEPTFLIPNNVSILGKLRYGAFSFMQDLRSKTKFWVKSDPVDAVMLGTVGYLILLMCTLLIGAFGGWLVDIDVAPRVVASILITPFLLTILLGILLLSLVVIRPVLYGACHALKGNFLSKE